MTIVERREGEVVPQGLSVTRCHMSESSETWRLRISDRMVRLRVRKQTGKILSCELVERR